MNTKPYVQVAAACERVLEEKDGVLSAIRLIDTLQVEVVPIDRPTPAPKEGAMLAPAIELAILVVLKAGSLRGDFKYSFEMERPSGKRMRLLSDYTIGFTDSRTGVNIKSRFFFPQEEEPGTYWFIALWEGEELTRFQVKLEVLPPKSTRATSDAPDADSVTPRDVR